MDNVDIADTIAEEIRCGRTRDEIVENIDQMNDGREAFGLAPVSRDIWIRAIDAAFSAKVGFPHQFQLSEYQCSWLASGRVDDDGDEAGGCVAVRVAKTGNDDDDWIVSDEEFSTLAQATTGARAIIEIHETETVRYRVEVVAGVDAVKAAVGNRDELLVRALSHVDASGSGRGDGLAVVLVECARGHRDDYEDYLDACESIASFEELDS